MLALFLLMWVGLLVIIATFVEPFWSKRKQQ